MLVRAHLALVAAIAASLLAPGRAAAAAAEFAPCGRGAVECAIVPVPLDRTGAAPGTVSLYVERLRASGTPRGVVFLIAGGPGQGSAHVFDLASSSEFYRDLFPGYTLAAFDPRGTGLSGLLRCPELQAEPAASPARQRQLVAGCAGEIGPRRSFYSTWDHAQDVDAVRQALGVDRIALWGTSYGTQLSVAYALVHPSHVERLILDSVATPEGRDPFATDLLRELPKGLASICGGGSCRAATPSFVADVIAVANRLAARPLRGPVLVPGGRRTVSVDGVDFLGAVVDSDLNAGLAAELPAAVRAARQGRPRPLLRVVELDRQSSVLPAEDLSFGLLAATVCDDGPFPWQPETPLERRQGLLDAARAALPAGATGPFGRWATDIGPAAMCLLWPAQAPRPRLGAGPLPDVPVLVLAGDRDLRTPAAKAAAVAARFPQGRLVVVPGVGHSVLTADLTGCARNALKTWLGGGVPGRCRRGPQLVAPLAAFPASVAALDPPSGLGGLRGRTLRAAGRTVREAAATWTLAVTGFAQAPPVLAGPFGGTLRLTGAGGFSLARYSAIPGLQLTGSLRISARGGPLFPLRFVGSVQVAGPKAAHGRLRVGRSALVGTLRGRAVRGPACC